MKPTLGRRGVSDVVAVGIVVGCALGLVSCTDPPIVSPTAAPIGAEATASTSNSTVSETALAPPPTDSAFTDPTTSLDGNTTGPTSPVVAPIEETGIPGLDSGNSFCAAWSRFAGSFQIVTPAWLVATDPNENLDPAALEAAASQTMVAAYYDMGVSWPDALADSKLASMATYEPMFERMTRNLGYLRSVGATDDQLVALASWWEDQLSAFDGFTFPNPEDAPSDLRPFIEQAGELITANELPIPDDPALVTASEPLVALFDYLGDNCPDQGLLSGREVVEG